MLPKNYPVFRNLIFLLVFTLSPLVCALDINTASVEEIARELSYIGPIKAKRIVEYRTKVGGFVAIEQLLKVKGIGPKILERNRNKIEIATKPQKNNHTNQGHSISHSSPLHPSLDLPPTKQSHQTYSWFWDIVLILLLFGLCLFIFGVVWLRNARQDMPVLRKHLVSTTFVCAGCGKVGNFNNVRYNGFLNEQSIDGDLPPGWVCVPNWLGEPCDYCFDCSGAIFSQAK